MELARDPAVSDVVAVKVMPAHFCFQGEAWTCFILSSGADAFDYTISDELLIHSLRVTADSQVVMRCYKFRP